MLLPASGRERDNLWTHHFAESENSVFFFFSLTKNNPQRNYHYERIQNYD